MAIDPITGIPEESGALAGVPRVDTGEEAPAEDERTPINIPDVGLEEARAALQGRVAEESEKVKQEGQSALENQPAYVPPSDEAVDTVEGPDKYQRPEDMVSWQMNQLLGEKSPYLEAVAQRSEEQAQRYGMLGTSMAVGAGQRAAIESALPMAQQQGETSAKYGLSQQAAENQIAGIEAETVLGSALMQQRVALETQQKTLDHLFSLASQGLDLESQTVIADIQGRWAMVTDDASQRLDAALKEKLNSQSIDAETVASIRGAASDLIQNYQIAVETLLKDPDFLQLGGDTIQKTLNNMLKTTVASIQFMADSSGVNMDDYLDDFELNAAFTTTIPKPS